MTPTLFDDMLESATISPYREVVAFERLYSLEGMSLKKIADMTVLKRRLPSEAEEQMFGMVAPDDLSEVEEYVSSKIGSFSVAVNMTTSWPDKLIDSARPTPILYYRGHMGLLEKKSVSVVGARKASGDGLSRARRVARELAANGVVVATGLAAGIDEAAIRGSIDNGGKTIAVIGTPIDECYPKENARLQERIASDHLLLSQVPFYRYSVQPFGTKKYYFPERNELMAAVSDATIIVEASDTSGTLTQARACLRQGRPLFIMRSCLDAPGVTWPEKYLSRPGVHILDDVGQVLDAIGC